VIVELRVFTTYAGKTEEFVRLYETKGLQIQEPILGRLLGMFRTEFGPNLDVIILWGYGSEEDRRERRSRLAASAEWAAFRKEGAPLVRDEETRLLIPTERSPMR
jgi:hypothetical protein